MGILNPEHVRFILSQRSVGDASLQSCRIDAELEDIANVTTSPSPQHTLRVRAFIALIAAVQQSIIL